MNNILKQNIVKELGLDKLPEKEQAEALLSIGRIIFQSVLIRTMEVLNKEDKDEFEKVLATNSEEKIHGFLQSKVPNLNSIVDEEVAKFKQESVDFMKTVK